MSSDPFGVCLQPECTDEESTKELPSFKDMAKQFISSAADVVGGVIDGTDILVTEHVYTNRITTCHGCEFFRKDDKRCTKCGCFMEAKTRFAKTNCPIGKW